MAKDSTQKTDKKIRIASFDLIRLTALLFMLLTHTISYFYTGESPFLIGLRDWGNLVSFTTFLFVSGAVSYLAYLKDYHKNDFPKSKLFRRASFLYLGYVFLAIAVTLPQMLKDGVIDISRFGKIALLIDLPGYTEFLIPFVIYSLALLAIPRIFKYTVKDTAFLVLFSILFYLVGEILYRELVLMQSPFKEWGALIYGMEGLYRFPLLQYFPVFLVGMHWGFILQDGVEQRKEIKRELALILSLGSILLSTYVLADRDEVLRRWPPSAAFISIGVSWVALLYLLFQRIDITRNISEKIYHDSKVLQIFSQHSFGFLIIHTLLITVGVYYLPLKSKNVVFVVFYFIVSLILSYVLNMLWGFLRNHTFRVFEGSNIYSNLQIAITPLVILLGVVALAGFDLQRIDLSGNNGTKIQIDLPTPVKYWYDEKSPYKYDLVFENIDQKTGWAEVDIDHRTLVEENISREDAKDMKLTYWDEENEVYKNVAFAVSKPNTDKTTLAVNLADFSGNDINTLELYMGDLFNEKGNLSKYPDSILTNISVSFSDIIAPKLDLDIDRLWHVTNDELNYSFEIPEGFVDSDALNYEILDYEDMSVEQEGLINWEPGRQYSNSLGLKNLGYGKYYFRLRLDISDRDEDDLDELAKSYSMGIVFEGGEVYSSMYPLIYSAPMYMTWTIDWEGYDLQQQYMDQMTALVDKYDMPMTHYFNPRIYVNLSKSRADYLTSWVKQREKMGDEVSLHLHMHCDMVTASGLEAKTEPSWGGREECHDVLTTAYDYEEFKKLVTWSIAKFRENGLSTPKGYRAGGWFLDLENMKVLNDLGFTYDTSGSDYEAPYGPNQQKRDWRGLSPTTRPYQVSQSNINNSNPPLMSIWEYPNNGADSTNREASELVRRFDLNINQYGSDHILDKPQVLTYLSHPHWFYIDQPKLTVLFDHTEPYKYEDDKGPVIYKTQIDAHTSYQEVK